MNVLLDTHVWIWWLTGDARLTRVERDAIDRAADRGEVKLSAISLWEAQVLHSKERLSLPAPFHEWIEIASAAVTVLPLDLEVVLALDRLPDGFHGDPADRLIVATARAHALALATRDAAIRRSRAVRLWRAGSR